MIWGYIGQAVMGGALILAAAQALGYAYPRILLTTLLLAFSLLIMAHCSSNFWLQNVVLHSHTAKPFLYKVAGVWGNHEGSMLLWTLLLSIPATLIRLEPKTQRLAHSIMGAIVFSFILFMIMACDPFALSETLPLEGQDLNPLLQDPALAIHPPILYAGYTMSLIPFTLAILTLWYPQDLHNCLAVMRRWAMISWTLIITGVALGSFWAYYELGWGGWWFWDPVENAALMPFLSSTALIHTIKASDKKQGLTRWTLFLSILTFLLALLGLFLVRSGVLTSVHNFAFDPERGYLLLLILGVTTLLSMGLFSWKSKLFAEIPQPAFSRKFLILLLTLVILASVFSVALGTLYPLLLEAFGWRITVGAPFFNTTVVPMLLPLLIIGGISILTPWIPMPWAKIAPKMLSAFILAAVSTVIAYGFYGLHHFVALFAVFGSFWFIGTSLSLLLKRIRSQRITLPFLGMTLAHVGICVAILGMLGGFGCDEEVIKALSPGSSLTLHGHSLILEKVSIEKGPNYSAQRAHIRVGSQLLLPERRGYWTQGIIHGETAIVNVGLSHIYVALGEPYEEEKWSIRAYYKSGINLLWLGVLLMICGGICTGIYLFRSTVLILTIVSSISSIHAIDAHEVLPAPILEQRARSLFKELLCPVCSGQTLEESPIEEARTIRNAIRKNILNGLTDEEILADMTNRYGDWVKQNPGLTLRTAVLWGLPWIMLILLIVAYSSRRQKKIVTAQLMVTFWL